MARIPTHLTQRYPLNSEEGGGWEFICPHCTYRARYTLATRKLVVLNDGDQRYHHTTLPQLFLRDQEQEMQICPPNQPIVIGDSWLPQHVVEQIEDILARCGL